jgi:hypothetical protein
MHYEKFTEDGRISVNAHTGFPMPGSGDKPQQFDGFGLFGQPNQQVPPKTVGDLGGGGFDQPQPADGGEIGYALSVCLLLPTLAAKTSLQPNLADWPSLNYHIFRLNTSQGEKLEDGHAIYRCQSVYR